MLLLDPRPGSGSRAWSATCGGCGTPRCTGTELRACSIVANVRLRSPSFSNEAKKLSFAALWGLPLRLLDCVIPCAARGAEGHRAVLLALDSRDRHNGRSHRPTDDPAAEAVQHAGEVQCALAGRDCCFRSEHHSSFGPAGWKSRFTRSGHTLTPSTPSTPSPPPRRRLDGTYAPWILSTRISRSTRLMLISFPSRRSWACTRRDP